MKSARLLSLTLGIVLAVSLSGTALGSAPEYVIETAFTDMGAATWKPSMLVIDSAKFGAGSMVTIRIKNTSNEDFGFVVAKLGITEHVPAFTERTVRLRLGESGAYTFYSNQHALITAEAENIDSRPQVPGWLLVGSSERAEQLYLNFSKHLSKALLHDLRALHRESVQPHLRPALIETCADLVAKLQWATEQLWLSGQKSPDPPAYYRMIRNIANKDIAPTFRKLIWPLKLPTAVQEAMMEHMIAKLAKMAHFIQVMQPVSKS